MLFRGSLIKKNEKESISLVTKEKEETIGAIQNERNSIQMIKKFYDDASKRLASLESLRNRQNIPAAEISSYDGIWGDWHNEQICPAGQYVCGLRVRFEHHQGDGDDTALNAVRLKCCRF